MGGLWVPKAGSKIGAFLALFLHNQVKPAARTGSEQIPLNQRSPKPSKLLLWGSRKKKLTDLAQPSRSLSQRKLRILRSDLGGEQRNFSPAAACVANVAQSAGHCVERSRLTKGTGLLSVTSGLSCLRGVGGTPTH